MRYFAEITIITSCVIALVIALSAWNMTESVETFTPQQPMESFYDLEALTIDGDTFSFNSLEGKRVLIVNTASKCGFTGQYEGLEKLNQNTNSDDFVILGFPCNNFGNQEPGSADDIASFCTKNFGVTFQMMDKVDVKGSKQHVVYQWLCDAEKNGVSDNKVMWNFHKFLINENGELISSLRSGVDPMDATILSFANRK
jgi:glutathione peroxidase